MLGKWRASYFSLLLLSALLIISLSFLVSPDLFFSDREDLRFSTWGDRDSTLGAARFTIRSRGLLTTDYPIDVDILLIPQRAAEECLHKAKTVDVIISGSLSYPEAYEGFPRTANISISPRTGMGKGRIAFAEPGAYTHYSIYVNGSLAWESRQSDETQVPIFVIENYSIRNQLQTTVRSAAFASAIACLVGLKGTVETLLQEWLEKQFVPPP